MVPHRTTVSNSTARMTSGVESILSFLENLLRRCFAKTNRGIYPTARRLLRANARTG